jgi:RimJ/RimL family protein N-acetyltransferase
MDLTGTLTGKHVRLEPLALTDVARLWGAAAADHAAIFRWYTHPVPDQAAMCAWVEKALSEQERGLSVPFITIDQRSHEVAGSTRFMSIDRENRNLEIGSTWLAPRFQRTAINTEAKYLMLRHAFEVWGCVRVQLKTDALNAKSRAAIARLGAKEEGTLRAHLVRHDGSLRDSVLFSILASEWPDIKRRLEGMLG